MESVAGVLLAGAGPVWASAGIGASVSPTVAIANPMRETALITLPLMCVNRVALPARKAANAREAPAFQAHVR